MEPSSTSVDLSYLLNANILLDKLIGKITDQSVPNGLNDIFKILHKDILDSRERLTTINPGRRIVIEKRLEYILRSLSSKTERTSRNPSLDDLFKTSSRPLWESFSAEVALYQMLELFFLKALECYGWRTFHVNDIARLGFAAHSFLNQHATDFAHDKHCWNFVRANLYSWYVPSNQAVDTIAQILSQLTLSWNETELTHWLISCASLQHLGFGKNNKIPGYIIDFIENQLQTSFVDTFQSQPVCKKCFIPCMGTGELPLAVLDKIFTKLNGSVTGVQRSVWGCETETINIFLIEVLSLLKSLHALQKINTDEDSQPLLKRIPHSIHAIQLLALELHHLEQLPLNGPEVARLHQGSAGQIQQHEIFDISIVTDEPSHVRSVKWLKALVEQLPYYKRLISTGSNLNWGELNLYLALTKLKEEGLCVYLSHRVLPEGGDGDKLRRLVLNLAKLEYFLELPEAELQPYRYLYIFRRTDKKIDRDQHRPYFGKSLSLNAVEQTNCTQSELIERGWDHMFVRGAAPLIRHLNHKFPKLFQLATIQQWNADHYNEQGLFENSKRDLDAIEVLREEQNITFRMFRNLLTKPPQKNSFLIFPHNPVDLSWVYSILQTPPIQFWIRNEILNNGFSKNSKLTELRLAPIVDLTRVSTSIVHESLEFLGQEKPNEDKLKDWACNPNLSTQEQQAKFVALAKRHSTLGRLINRYEPLFIQSAPNVFELRADTITEFYPVSLLIPISQLPEARVQYVGREKSKTFAENWVISDCHSTHLKLHEKLCAQITLLTNQGASIELIIPQSIGHYVFQQIQALKTKTWGEILSLLKVPKDPNLFILQATEITKVFNQTRQELQACHTILAELSIYLFDIAPDARQFL